MERVRRNRDRSRIVCCRCHSRKVKCDLRDRIQAGNQTCTNCSKRAETCERRRHAKSSPQRQHSEARAAASNGATDAFVERIQNSTPLLVESTPQSTAIPAGATLSPTTPRIPASQGFLGQYSALSELISPAPSRDTGPSQVAHASSADSYARTVEQQILNATQVGQLAPAALQDALITKYFDYSCHRMPVVDRQDLISEPSPLLTQALCLAGSVLRDARSPTYFVDCERYYVHAKILFSCCNEPNALVVLKAACLISCFNTTYPNAATIDSSWNWLGIAIRLAIQMGLHQESTYVERNLSPGTRKIAWYLFAHDKFMSACFGRPQSLTQDGFDVRLPVRADFEPSEQAHAEAFILYADLSTILARLPTVKLRESTNLATDAQSILSDFRRWASQLPTNLQLIHTDGNRTYDRELYEITTMYLTCLITFFHIYGRLYVPVTVSRVCLTASSCMIRILQEMDYRDDINHLLGINNWGMLVAALPIINALYGASDSTTGTVPDVYAAEELNILMTIFKGRILKYPGVQASLDRIEAVKASLMAQRSGENTTGFLRPLATKIPDALMEVTEVEQLLPFRQDLSSRLALLHAPTNGESADGYFDGLDFEALESMFNFPDLPEDNWLGFQP